MVFHQILKYPVDHNLRRITKSDKDFAKILDFKDIKFPVKIRDIHNNNNNNNKTSLRSALLFVAMKIKHSVYVSKKCSEDKCVDLLLIGEGKKKHYVLSKILIHLCMIIYYIVEENIFVVIVYMLLLQKKF